MGGDIGIRWEGIRGMGINKRSHRTQMGGEKGISQE